MSANYLKEGSYNFICDTCGQKYKREDGKLQWDLLFTCYNCYDPKHPWLEPLPIPIDALPVPLARPRPNPTFLGPGLNVMGIWGVRYKLETGFVTAINWGGWTGFWGGDSNVPFNAINFPLQ